MSTPWLLCAAAVAAGHLLIAGAQAAPPAGGMSPSVRLDIVRIQAVPEAFEDRMARLRQHRAILQDAFQPARRALPAEPPEPQARALRPPQPADPQVRSLPQEAANEGRGQVSCEDAALIVADFGFSDIGEADCSGDLYRFSAMRDGTAYAIGINAATGEIAEVSRQ